MRFADGLETLFATPFRIYLEVGPGSTLSALVRSRVKSSLMREDFLWRKPGGFQAFHPATLKGAPEGVHRMTIGRPRISGRKKLSCVWRLAFISCLRLGHPGKRY